MQRSGENSSGEKAGRGRARFGGPTLRSTPLLARRGHRSWTSLAAVAATAAVLATTAACSGDTPLTTPDGKPISTTTTRIADVNVVSADRDYAKTCLAPTAREDGAADAERIVVTDPVLLDAVCALGLGPKVTAIAAPHGSVPAYLGPQLTSVPAIGSGPDRAAIAAARPDLVLTTPATAGAARAFRGITADTITPSPDWRAQFRAVAAALGRPAAADRLLTEFATEVGKTGRRMDALHSQVSLVRFGKDSETVAGTGTFGGTIMAEVGVQRPAPQRRAESFPIGDKNFTDADADLIYVSFEGPEGLAHGKEVLRSDRWLDMGAPTWNRVLIVDDDVWYRSSGLAAAWLVLNDLKGSLDGSSANY